MKGLGLAAVAGCMAVLTACDSKLPTASADPPRVKVASGELTGGRADGVEFFKGIPYAAAPVGDLRWRPPQPAPVAPVARDASSYGPDCAQEPFPYDAAPSRNGFSENCLFLNVWRPAGANPKAKLPVMVWIHGGGFINGGTTPAVYDGSRFAAQGIAFVSINYRLGRFGFFAFPALSAEHPDELKANYGYMDQPAALKWIKANIAAFGGDPNNVMVFGESAGGSSVHMLLTTPLAAGLFNKAGIESGGGRGSLIGPRRLKEDLPNLPSGETLGVNFARANGIEGTGPEALAALRALPTEKIVDGLTMMGGRREGPPTYGGPVLDGQIVIGSPQDAYLAKRETQVPTIVGANDADAGFGGANTLDEALLYFGPDAEKARAAYGPDPSPDQHIAIGSIAMDRGMVEPARFVAQTFAAHGTPTYEFRFAYVAPAGKAALATNPFASAMLPGAQHASEIPYIFDTVPAAHEATAEDLATAKAVNAYWANFAKTGNPNGPGPNGTQLPEWPAYAVATDAVMIFTPDGPKGMRDPGGTRLDLVAAHARGK